MFPLRSSCSFQGLAIAVIWSDLLLQTTKQNGDLVVGCIYIYIMSKYRLTAIIYLYSIYIYYLYNCNHHPLLRKWRKNKSSEATSEAIPPAWQRRRRQCCPPPASWSPVMAVFFGNLMMNQCTAVAPFLAKKNKKTWPGAEKVQKLAENPPKLG